MYLHYLLNRNENDVLSKFLTAQIENPKKNDWYIDVEKDLKDFNINISLQELTKMSKGSLKRLVQRKSKEKAFNDLIELKNSHEKVKNIEYKNWKCSHT